MLGRLALLLGLVALGCATSPSSRFPDAAAALARMRATVACSRGVRAEAKVDFFGPEGRVRGDLAILTSLPDSLRLDAFSPFGMSLSTLTSDGERFVLFDLKERAVLTGRPLPCNMARFTRVPLPPFVLAQLLRGEAPVLAHRADAARIGWESSFLGSGHYVVTVTGNRDSEERIRMVPHPDDFLRPWSEQRIRVVGLEVRQQGRVLYEVEMADHERASAAQAREDPDGLDEPIPPSGPACSAELPRRLRLRVPDAEQDVVIHLKTVHHNPPLVAGAFGQVVPGGVVRREATCREAM